MPHQGMWHDVSKAEICSAHVAHVISGKCASDLGAAAETASVNKIRVAGTHGWGHCEGTHQVLSAAEIRDELRSGSGPHPGDCHKGPAHRSCHVQTMSAGATRGSAAEHNPPSTCHCSARGCPQAAVSPGTPSQPSPTYPVSHLPSILRAQKRSQTAMIAGAAIIRDMRNRLYEHWMQGHKRALHSCSLGFSLHRPPDRFRVMAADGPWSTNCIGAVLWG